MANVKITELTAATALAGTDVLPIVDVGADATKKVSVSDLLRNLPDGTASAPALAFADDQNTGVLSPGDNSLAFATSGTQRLVIDSSGNCGIGTTSPSAKLHANSGSTDVVADFESGDANAWIQIRDNSTTDTAVMVGAVGDDMRLRAGSNERVRIDSSGNVGIGDSSPSNKLVVKDGGSPTIEINGQGRAASLTLGVTASESKLFEGSNNALAFGTNNTERMRINSSGNVGIGETSPDRQVHVKNTTDTTHVKLETTSSTGRAQVQYTSPNAEWFQGIVGASTSGDFLTYTADSKNITWYTSGSERMRIDSSGRVLVGTASSTTLANTSTVQISASDSNAGLSILRTASAGGVFQFGAGSSGDNVSSSDALGYIKFTGYHTNGYDEYARITAEVDSTNGDGDAPGRLIFSTTVNGGSTPSERMRINNSGRLLINTTSVLETSTAAKLQITHTSGALIALGRNDAAVTTGNDMGKIAFYGNDGGGYEKVAQILCEADGPHASGDKPGRLMFETTADGASSPTERMRIDSSGNVGIGTSSPAYEFDVRSSDTTTVNINAGTSNLSRLFFSDTTIARGYLNYDHSGDSLRIGTAGSEVVRISSGGSVGIGTTSPQAPFTISNGGAQGIEAGYSSGTSTNFIQAYNRSSSAFIQFDVIGNPLVFKTGSSATEHMRLNGSGKLLLGCTSPTGGASEGDFVVEFAGDADNAIKTRDTDNNGTVNHMVFISGSTTVGSISGTTSTASFNNLSDYRTKENDVEIADGIQKLKLLRPIRFNYISEPNTVCDGFFAHEVTPAVPTAVTGAKDAVDSEGEIDPQMLDASKLVPLLTAALQEAIAKIETLETKVAALEAQ